VAKAEEITKGFDVSEQQLINSMEQRLEDETNKDFSNESPTSISKQPAFRAKYHKDQASGPLSGQKTIMTLAQNSSLTNRTTFPDPIVAASCNQCHKQTSHLVCRKVEMHYPPHPKILHKSL
jgi:acyl transferase domain-containing protein